MEVPKFRKTSRKLSTDLHRKLSAISTCSDVSNISYKLGMDPGDFKSTIQNILGTGSLFNCVRITHVLMIILTDLDVGEGWDLESEDGLSCYGEEQIRADFDLEDDVPNDVITVNVERKSSTGSQVSTTDSLNAAEDFEPVHVDLTSIRTALSMYQRHNQKKISMSKIVEEGREAEATTSSTSTAK